ncbi:MAG: phosphoribosylglycinamide formyltransferase [Gammaproteobacteria bacterium]|nr:phosphoribosylglycinamide formyltransferase [Gammaproteobacteria bacterium]
MTETKTLAILISGNGSNLQAIIDAINTDRIAARIAVVISNTSGAFGLQRARHHRIDTEVIDHRQFAERDAFDTALGECLAHHTPNLIVLAGFMRILGREFVLKHSQRIVNIHPALLPNYPGLNTHQRALEDGVERHGATVHYVTADLDSGPIIIQGAVPVNPDDTVDSLQQRVLQVEHRIYPLAIDWHLQGRLTMRGNHVLLDGELRPEQGLDIIGPG